MHKVPKELSKKYNLFTAIAMVVGIVIGSGIFFKADNILVKTNGSVAAGVLAWLIVGIGVIAGGLAISMLAVKNPEEGGLIAYGKDTFGKPLGFLVGWVSIATYFPAIAVILSYVAALYTAMLFGIEDQRLIALTAIGYGIFSYLLNMFAPKGAGVFQNTATVLKLLPLAVIAIAGIFFGKSGEMHMPTTIFHNAAEAMPKGSILTLAFGAFLPVAFAYDGWYVATSISGEIKDSEKNLPRALIIGILVIMTIYIAYFYGISKMLGAEIIIEAGNGHIAKAGEKLIGHFGGNILMVFVIISVLGGLNGMTLGYIRLPYALANQGIMKNIANVKKVNEKYDTPLNSALLGFVFIIFWAVMLYVSSIEGSLLRKMKFDISEMPVTFTYVALILIYIGLIRFAIKGLVPRVKGIVYGSIAIAISLFVLYGSIMADNGLWYIVGSLTILAAGLPLYKREKNH